MSYPMYKCQFSPRRLGFCLTTSFIYLFIFLWGAEQCWRLSLGTVASYMVGKHRVPELCLQTLMTGSHQVALHDLNRLSLSNSWF